MPIDELWEYSLQINGKKVAYLCSQKAIRRLKKWPFSERVTIIFWVLH
jgi:hypothetical protein